MSASLRSPKPAGAREPVSGSGKVAVSERGPVMHRRRGRLVLIDSSEPAEQVALRGGLEQSGGRSSVPELGLTSRDCHAHLDLGEHAGRVSPTGGVERPSRRPATLGRRPTAHDRQTGLNLDGVDRHAEQEALAVSQGHASSPLFALDPRLAEHTHSGQRELDVPGKHNKQPTSARGTKQLSVRPPVLERDLAAHVRHSHPGPGSHCVPGEHAKRAVLEVGAERPGGLVLPGPRPRPEARPGARLGCRRGVAGLVAVCVLALGAAACSVKDAKAEASVSASASASAAIARAEKGIADANASATASREAALTPELRAKRDAALAEPAPAKPQHMNEESPEGAVASVGYFLDLYRYAYMTGNTTELAAMSDGQCIFCKSAIDNSTKLHAEGGWKDKWEQKFSDVSFHEKVEGNNYNRVDVTASHGQIVKHPGGSAPAVTDNETKEKTLTFAMCYVNGRWMVREVEVIDK